jgi:hypothetical protein
VRLYIYSLRSSIVVVRTAGDSSFLLVQTFRLLRDIFDKGPKLINY